MGDSRKLAEIKNSLDPYRRINQVHTFKSTGRNIYGVCIWFDRIVISGERMKIFSQEGQPVLGPDELDQFRDPLGICTLDGNLLVCCRNEINILGNSLKCLYLGGTEPKRVCTNSKGQILVTTFRDTVLILDRKGDSIREFGYCRQENGQFMQPVGICTNSRDEILVTDMVRNRIQIFSPDGEFLFGFGSKGDKPDQFSWPRGICVDGQDNIYVTDYGNHRISVFTPKGIPVQQFHVFGPSDLCIAGRKIIVTSANNSIIVQKYQVQQKSGGWLLHRAKWEQNRG